MGKIAVIGDVMLDVYDYCRNRENPESSAPCYVVEKRECKPGGAGNVAANLVKLGSDICLIGTIGNDPESYILIKTLEDSGIPHRLIKDDSRATILKERTISLADKRYHFRKDRERKMYIEDSHVSEILRNIHDYELIIISDYNKGMISEKLMGKLKETGIKILVDPKPNHKSFYSNVFLITPNRREALEMAGLGKDELEKDAAAAEKLREELDVRVLLTRSELGVSYFGLSGDKEKNFEFGVEVPKDEVVDVTGAGDTVIATFSHFFNKGYDIKECARLANKAAGIAVRYAGCYQVSEKELA